MPHNLHSHAVSSPTLFHFQLLYTTQTGSPPGSPLVSMQLPGPVHPSPHLRLCVTTAFMITCGSIPGVDLFPFHQMSSLAQIKPTTSFCSYRSPELCQDLKQDLWARLTLADLLLLLPLAPLHDSPYMSLSSLWTPYNLYTRSDCPFPNIGL